MVTRGDSEFNYSSGKCTSSARENMRKVTLQFYEEQGVGRKYADT